MTGIGGTPIYGVTGPLTHEPSKGVNLNASGSFNQGNNTAFHVGNLFTIELWIKHNSVPAGNGGLFWNGGAWSLLLNGGGEGRYPRLFSGGYLSGLIDPALLYNTNWNHLVVVVNGAVQTFYVNGDEVLTGSIGVLNATGTSTRHIGTGDFGPPQSCFSEYAFYNTALSLARIRKHYYTGRVGTYEDEVLADSPRAFYRMQEASGQPQDSSGNANHTTAKSGTAGYSQPSPVTSDPDAKAINFSGDDWFTTPYHSTLDVGDVFTIEAWIKRPTTGGAAYRTILHRGSGSFQLFVEESTGRLQLHQSGIAYIAHGVDGTLQDTNWHHVVCTKSDATVRFYVDGVAGLGGGGGGDFSDGGTHTLEIGGADGAYTSNLLTSEVALYATALTQDRIRRHYYAALQEPILTGPVIVTPDTGVLTLSGLAPKSFNRRVLPLGIATLSGPAPKGRVVTKPSQGSITLSGLVPTSRWRLTTPTSIKVVTLSGLVPTFKGVRLTQPSIGQAVLYGITPKSLCRARPTIGQVTLSGTAAAFAKQFAATTGTATLSGQAPTWRIQPTPATGTILLYGSVADVLIPGALVEQILQVRSPLVWTR